MACRRSAGPGVQCPFITKRMEEATGENPRAALGIAGQASTQAKATEDSDALA